MNRTSETAGEPEARRSASQIMFGHLPEQTVDVNRGIWKVSRWRDPQTERSVDLEALKSEMLAQAKPWSDQGRDHGLGQSLLAGRRGVEVRSLARDRGIDIEPFPRLWLCPACKRVHKTGAGSCKCGTHGSRSQIHFVCYCPDCGTLEEPPVFSCPTHRETRIKFPGTMSADQIVQDCPVCDRELRRGFVGKPCPRCSRPMTPQVHRAASVYTPRSVVIVNPPSIDQHERIENVGGGSRALSWVLSGLTTRWMDEAPAGPDSLRADLLSKGLSAALVKKMIDEAIASGEVAPDPAVSVPISIRDRAQREAKHIAVALSASRKRLSDLVSTAPLGLKAVYETHYPTWLDAAGLEAVEFVDRFPVLTGHFGYTRGPSTDSNRSVLVPFVDNRGNYVVYGEVAETEALFVRLDPIKVARWLRRTGVAIDEVDTLLEARLAILDAVTGDTTGQAQELVTTLVHSYAHRLVRVAAVHAGVERTSLSEFLVPIHLGFFMYAAARGDFVMGGLQAVYEGEMQLLLRDFVLGERRCPLDPGCAQNGAACMACLHLGEPSCRLFNRSLSRETLFGPLGYLMSDV